MTTHNKKVTKKNQNNKTVTKIKKCEKSNNNNNSPSFKIWIKQIDINDKKQNKITRKKN